MKEIVDRSGLQYAAAACVIVGGLLVGGPGLVAALADTGGVGQHDGGGSHPGSGGGLNRDKTTGVTEGTTSPQRGDNPGQRRPGQWPGGDKPGGDKPGGNKPGGDKPGQGDGSGAHDPCDDGGNGGDGGVGTPPPGSGSGPSRHHGRRPPPVITPGPPQQPQPGPVEPDIIGATAGPAEAPAPEAGPPVLTLPLVVPPEPAVGGVGPGPRVELPRGTPGAPAEVKNEPLEPMPGEVGHDVGLSSGFRTGYSDYLRTAGVTQMAALALPGVGGILLLTAGGGFIGYRQAKAGHLVRTEGIARFLH
ncbi:hypothetical protein [Mycobacterium sp.]|uniref:hypothetical protein n=1 Tax=Mycobacterium sp. TaxID=1785 RepID=UPI002CA594E8|nr:hypothetical protein [Mycobacterium sp.]HME48170.1 hypothetical protein [Mycobacterium sp.]